MELIAKWLAGSQNFLSGRILYHQFGSNEKLKQLFARGEKTPGAKEQLIQALRELVTPAKAPEASINNMPAGDDPVSNAIHADWKNHYTAMNMLRGRLQAYGEDNSPESVAECNELCQQILEHERHITACWEQLRHYNKHGKLPEAQEEKFEIPAEPLALAKLIETLKRNIRRNKQKAAKEPDNALYPALVKKYEAQLKQIDDAKN